MSFTQTRTQHQGPRPSRGGSLHHYLILLTSTSILVSETKRQVTTRLHLAARILSTTRRPATYTHRPWESEWD